jgi:hypothetical protein
MFEFARLNTAVAANVPRGRGRNRLGIAAGLAVLASAFGATAAVAQSTCSNPLPAGNFGIVSGGNLFNSWGPSAVCATASAATSITSAITTVNMAFITEASAFVSAPNNPSVNQLGGGIWIRGVGGQNIISSTGTATGVPVGGTLATESRERTGYGGFQAGVDLGRFNLGGSGLNVVFGVTGGLLDATANEEIGPGHYTFNVPFIGGYVAVTQGHFFADAQVRGDFYNMAATNSNLGLSGAGFNGDAVTFTTSAGYRYDIGSYFVEPSVGFIWSRLSSIGSLAVPGIPITFPLAPTCCVPPGTLSFNSIDSAIGRAGLRVGTSFQNGNLALQPFITASVWDEFASNAKSTFTPTGGGFALDVDSSRVGVFGQFGVGVAGKLLNTGWLGYVRGDYRTGDNITGWDVTGGIRYEFSFAAPSAAPIITK